MPDEADCTDTRDVRCRPSKCVEWDGVRERVLPRIVGDLRCGFGMCVECAYGTVREDVLDVRDKRRLHIATAAVPMGPRAGAMRSVEYPEHLWRAHRGCRVLGLGLPMDWEYLPSKVQRVRDRGGVPNRLDVRVGRRSVPDHLWDVRRLGYLRVGRVVLVWGERMHPDMPGNDSAVVYCDGYLLVGERQMREGV